ncbi:hypothetical protein QR680_003789 [Steinernema hermaphroditum]|uniref:F-box domain-containing protein n=1 Tax=Steinernema hermaphroditum TaxID=289476 RepID=A0AA39HNT9_9BILA|nr:hypothetical protein QR680_003789 [Steinernema hermaphroditum]
MDELPYDLVDHLIHFLPLSDITTIAEAAADKPELENWSLVAENHIEERVILDIDVYIPKPDILIHSPKRRKSADGFEQPLESIRVSLRKRGECAEVWDDKSWRYTWIGRLRIHSTELFLTTDHRSSDVQELLRIAKMPVDPGQSLLCIQNVNQSRWISGGCKETDVALDIARAFQKTFAEVTISNCSNGQNSKLEDFVIDYINGEGSLLHLGFDTCIDVQRQAVAGAVVSLFKKKSYPGTSILRVDLPPGTLRSCDVERLIENWRNTDGRFELRMRMRSNDWTAIRSNLELVNGYLAHPMKMSSLFCCNYCISTTRFEDWHLPATFEWIEGLINDWKNGDGLCIYKGQRQVKLFMEREEWLELAEKYGPLQKKNRSLPAIGHQLGTALLEVRKKLKFVTFQVKRLSLSSTAVMF